MMLQRSLASSAVVCQPVLQHFVVHWRCVCSACVQASYGAGLAVLATDLLCVTDISNTVIAHNTALQAGGGLWCQDKDASHSEYRLTNNTWLNNTAFIRGGGVITNLCNVTVHGDRFLGNEALQEGGGLMVFGGEAVMLQNIQVSVRHSVSSWVLCNSSCGQLPRGRLWNL